MTRFTVSVPTPLLEELDRKLVGPGQTRSEAVRRVLEEALHDLEERENIERYVRGYRAQPQTDEEFGWADHVTQERLADERWA